MPRLTSEQAASVAALDGDANHIAYEALRRGDHEGELTALQLWTAWRRAEVTRLLPLRGPRPSAVKEALNEGLTRRVGRRLGHGERATFDLLVRLYVEAGGLLRLDCEDEHGRLRICERCDLVTRGGRYATRCLDCGYRYTDRTSDGLPRFAPCPVCHVRPVSD